MQALGTSYVNELDSQKALHNLKAWVQHNPKYSGLEIAVDEYSDGTLMDEVRENGIKCCHSVKRVRWYWLPPKLERNRLLTLAPNFETQVDIFVPTRLVQKIACAGG